MNTRQPLLETRSLAKRFGMVEAVRPLDLSIYAGDFFAILGPSGCGKTTLLRMIGGFVRPTEGRLLINGEDVTRLNPEHRPTNMVFQGYGLFPHMNVRQNISYGLRLAKIERKEIDRRVDEILALVQIKALAQRSIHELSGGQQQRVSLARALIMRPKLLLLDEPLAALDLKLRYSMQEELRNLHREIGGTFVFVTHDQGEAMALANRIAIMRDGKVEQEGTSEEIYAKPKNSFVATFIGETNKFAGRRRAGKIWLDEGLNFKSLGTDRNVTVVVRPEALIVAKQSLKSDAVLKATLMDRVFLGTYERFRLRFANGRDVFAHRPIAKQVSFDTGQNVEVGWQHADQWVFEEDAHDVPAETRLARDVSK